MSDIQIVKGLPISLLIGLTQNNVPVAINDGQWNVEVMLRQGTVTGPEIFPIISTPADNSLLIELTSEQTQQLRTDVSGYVLVVRASRLDDTVFLRNVLRVSVLNDI